MGGYNNGVRNEVDVFSVPTMARTTLTLPTGVDLQAQMDNGGNWSRHVLAAGGKYGLQRSDTVQIFDIDRQTWTTGKLSSGRHDFPSISSYWNGIGLTYFVGGMTADWGVPNNMPPVIDIFNHSQGLMSSTRIQLTFGRSYSSAEVVGKYLLVIGGRNGDESSSFATVDIIDIESLSMFKTIYLQHSRAVHASAVLGPYVYVGGGYRISVAGEERLASVEVIDTRSWTVFRVENLSYAGGALAAASNDYGAFFGGGGGGTTDAIEFSTCGNKVLHEIISQIVIGRLRALLTSKIN